MPKEPSFRNPRQPAKMIIAVVILICCALAPIPAASLSLKARVYVWGFAIIIGLLALMWIIRNRYDCCYLMITEQGIMKNGLINYAIPWDAIHGFDLYTKQTQSTTDDFLYVLITDLGAISHKSPFSWLAHQIPLLLARFRKFDGLYRRTLKVFNADSPEAAAAIKALREALGSHKSPGAKQAKSLPDTEGEIKLPCQTSIWYAVVILPILVLIIVLFINMMQDPKNAGDFRMLSLPLIVILAIPYLFQSINNRPYLATDDKGVTLNHRAKSQFIPWDAISRIHFMEKKNGSGETFLRYDVLIFKIRDEDRIVTKGHFGPVSESVYRITLPYRPRPKDEPAWIYRRTGRRFPKDLAERLTLRKERALAK